MKILIIGSKGQLGTDLIKVLSSQHELLPFDLPELDIKREENLREVISKAQADCIINCAAYNEVDRAEYELEEACRVNAFAVRHIARIAKRLDTYLIHLSTDYVFDGTKHTPYTELDIPNPISAYGVSKYMGEIFCRNEAQKNLIIRTSGLYGGLSEEGLKRNFVESMIRLGRNKGDVKVVCDQIVSPTYTLDLAEKIKEVLKTPLFGILHIVNSGSISWFDFAHLVFENAEMDVEIRPISTEELKRPAKRPAYSVLGSVRIPEIGLQALRPIGDALKAYFSERRALINET
jgi:dTDP-4-dehydrorhamnose reductase